MGTAALRPLRQSAARTATSPVVFATVEEQDRATSLLHRTEECGGGGPPGAAGGWRGRKAAGKGDAMRYIKGAEIYDHLEKVMDRFEDVADRISGILTENL